MNYKMHSAINLLPLLSLIFLSQMLFAQIPDTSWTKKFGGTENEECYRVIQTSDGGYIMIVNTMSFLSPSWKVWLIKTDLYGDTLWTKMFGTGVYGDYAYDVKQVQDGGYIIAGRTIIPGGGGIWLIRTNQVGDIIWYKIYGNHWNATANSIEMTTDSGYVVTGFDDINIQGSYNRYLILMKTDKFGDTLWTKYYGGHNYESVGNSVKQTSDGGYIITGYTKITDSTSHDCWLLKTNEVGDTLWTKLFSGEFNEEGQDVLQTDDNGYIVIGSTISYATGIGSDLWLIRTNAVGDTLWTKLMGGELPDYGISIQKTIDGGYIIAGRTASYTPGTADVWIVKTDYLGNIMWQKVLGKVGWDGAYSIQVTNDNGYIIGAVIQPGSASQRDAWLIKLETDTSIPVELESFTADLIDDCIKLNWQTASELNNKGFSIERKILDKTNWEEIGFVKGNGTTLTSSKYGYIDKNLITGVCSYRLKQIDFDGEYKYSKSVKIEVNLPIKYSLEQNYPNPFNPNTTIKYSVPQTSLVHIKVYDVLGNEVETLVQKEKPTGTYELTWNANNLPSGVYFYQLKAGDFIETKKMILMK